MNKIGVHVVYSRGMELKRFVNNTQKG